jgi:hypothetical protein
MSLEIVAGLLGSQLVRAVACEIATTLLCQTVQQAVSSIAQPRPEVSASLTPASGGASLTSPTAGLPMLTEPRALPTVDVVSAVAGRVRLRIHGLRDNAGRATEIVAAARALDGVTSAQANPRTGTLLVHFDPYQTSVPAIVAALEPPRPARQPRAVERTSHLRLVVG